MSKWFLLGAVVGFVILLFKFENFFNGQGMAIAGNGAAPGLPVNSGCGCTGPIVTALYAVPSDNPPATSNPGGSGFQYGKTPPANIGPVAPYIPPVIAGPTSLGGGGGAQYFNAAKPLPGSTRGVY